MTDALLIPGIEVPPLSCRLTGNVWGFDCSTRRIALGVVQGQGLERSPETGWFSLEVRKAGGVASRLAPVDLAWMFDALPPFLQRIAAKAPPAAVVVEQPFGMGKARPHPSSYYALAMLLAALAREVPDAPIEMVTPGEWKADALGAGQGSAHKPTILRWARTTLGYTGQCPKCEATGTGKCGEAARAHDEADALGVATSAAIRYQRDPR